MFCYIRKKFFIDHFQTYFDFFNEMPRNLMISGHLRFSFFSRCGTFVQRRSEKTKFRHILDSLTACRKLLFRQAEGKTLSSLGKDFILQIRKLKPANFYLADAGIIFIRPQVSCCKKMFTVDKKQFRRYNINTGSYPTDGSPLNGYK